MCSTNRTRIPGAAGVLALLLSGCGSSSTAKPNVINESAVSVSKVAAAMGAQPRVIQTQVSTDGNVQRVVVDTQAGYLALFSSGKLNAMDKDGVEYRQGRGCYKRFKATTFDTKNLWAGSLSEVTGARYTAKVVDDSVLYKSARGRVTVDARTNLIRSIATAAFPTGGVPGYSDTFSYPSFVAELLAPTPICH